MLLAEDLLLLLTDDDTGKSAASGAPCRRGGLRRAFARGPAGGQGSRSHGRQPAGRGSEHRGQKQGKKSRSVVARLEKRARVRLCERAQHAQFREPSLTAGIIATTLPDPEGLYDPRAGRPAKAREGLPQSRPGGSACCGDAP